MLFNCCCGKPIIAISTVDSSVNYTQLCNFEDAAGCWPPGVFPCGPVACSPPFNPPDGWSVRAPLPIDIAKYTADRQLVIDSVDAHGGAWPLAASEIIGRYAYWAGTKLAVVPDGEPDPTDSFGAMEFRLSGTASNARITLQDLKDLFETLYDKHFPPANEPGGVRDKNHEAVFLFDVDNSGSITIAQWPSSVRTNFLSWLATDYPNVRRREWTISNYLTDGEDWLRRLNDHYLDTVNGG
jgi:hypothetical protein